MKATIITIGDEILIGQIIDTNSGIIAKALDKIGVATHEMLSISDGRQHILDTLQKVQNQVDIVVITGGLGPTKDDITKKTFCEYFDDKLIENKEVLAHVTQLIEFHYKRPITQINKEQAQVPSKCEVLFNDLGTAPGMWMEFQNTVFVSLPGVPFEMKNLLENSLIPKIISKYKRPYIIHKTIMTYGQGESMVAERIENWENNLPKHIKLAYLPSPGKLKLRLSTKGFDEEALKSEINLEVRKLEKIISDIIVGYEEDESIEKVTSKLLRENNFTIATAESCTGGNIASLLSGIAGASSYFKGSIIAYSNEIKQSMLQIPHALIEEKTAVSEEVAIAMATNIKGLMQTDFAIATTGNAGPSKQNAAEDIGVVYIAIATPTNVFSTRFEFGKPREKVIERAVLKSLELLNKEIYKNVSKIVVS
jgi:nicotinamide-nucleotide amidase